MPRHPARHRPSATARRMAGWLAVALAAGLAGCYRPAPVVHAELRVPAQGDYLLDGAAVPPAQLRERLAVAKAGKAANGDLLLTIEPAPTADAARLRQAVEAARQAQVRVAFGGDAQALKAAPAASGTPAD